MNALPSTTSRPGFPAPITPALARPLAIAHNRLTPVGRGYEIAAVDAPTQETRRDLEIRAATLDHSLRPAGDGLIDDIASILMMPGRNADAGDVKARMRMYETDLADLPLWAVTMACADFRQGRAGDGWRPTQAEIRKRAARHTDPLATERAQIRAVLGAVVVTIPDNPERRKAIADKFRQVARSVQAEGQLAEATRSGDRETPIPRSPPLSEMTVTQAEAKLADIKATYDRPLTLSPAVRRSTLMAQGRALDAYDAAEQVAAEFEDQGRRSA